MRRSSYAALGIALACMLGCGPRTVDVGHRPPFQPDGAQVHLWLQGESKTQTVELLAVEDTAIIALRRVGDAPQLVIFPLARIKRADMPSINASYFVNKGKYEFSNARRSVALMARYPQGITPSLMALLLGDYHQAAPVYLGGGS